MSNHDWRGMLPDDAVTEATSPIYHYTSPAGLLGLISGREFWATEASGMNDVSEVRQGWDFTRAWLEEQDGKDDLIKELRRISVQEDSDEDQHPVQSREGVFMCCASLRGDDANQWRLYAGAARGYAVELDPRVPFTTIVEGQPPAPRHTKKVPAGPKVIRRVLTDRIPVSPWLHVLYSDQERDLALAGFVANAKDLRRQLLSDATDGRWDNETFYTEKQILDDTIAFDLSRLAQLMKSDGFSGEREVRMVVSDFFARTACFRATPYGVVRYSRLTNSPNGQRDNKVAYDGELKGAEKTLPIRSVRLGPLLHAQNNQATVKALLETHGFNGCSVFTSRVPLGH
jgi:hypothetical protein